MSKFKRHLTIFIICLGLTTAFVMVKNLRNDKLKSSLQTLPLVDFDPVKLTQKQKHSLSLPISTAKEKELQRRLEAAVADIMRLQQEKQLLMEKLDKYTREDNDIEVLDGFDTWKIPLSDYTKSNQAAEQLEDGFSYESQDLAWTNTI